MRARNAKSRPEARLEKTIISWQECQFWNQTFEEDIWCFDIEEIRELLDEGLGYYNRNDTGVTMDIVEEARAYERKYHEDLYGSYDLFEPGTWLYKPAAYAIKSFDLVSKNQKNIRVLDLGGGIGRHSIPAARYFGSNSKVVCVDLLGSAIKKLNQNTLEHNVTNVIGIEGDVETYDLADKPYDLILSISCIEHVPTKKRLEKLIVRLQNATRQGGVHCFMIITNNEWVESGTGKKLTPLIEQNLSSDETIEMLQRLYTEWNIHDLTSKDWQSAQYMDGRDVILKSTCIQFTAQK